jgi:hypothetical protein
MSIRWKRNKIKFTPSPNATTPNLYELEVFQGDSIDLFDYLEFTDNDLNIWKTTLVNAAYFTDNAADQSGPYKDEYADDEEIYQYASKYALVWKCELDADPLGIANVLVNKYGILDTSVSGIGVNMTLKVYPNWGKKAVLDGGVTPKELPKNNDAANNEANIEYLTVKIKSNSFLGEGGLLNSVTGSIDKYVTDANDYISGVLSGAMGYIGEGVGWAASGLTSLLGGSGKPKGYSQEEAKDLLEEEKDRETNLFSKVIGFPFAALDFLSAKENTALVKSGLRAISLSAKLYRAYTQGKTAYVTTILLANLKSLLDFDKLTPRQQIAISKFLGVNPKVLRRITWIVRKILEVKEFVDVGNYEGLETAVLKEMKKDSIEELDPDLKTLVTGELFEDTSLGSVVVKDYDVPNKDTVVISFDNPSYTKVPGNTLILQRITIVSKPESNGTFIPIKSVLSSTLSEVAGLNNLFEFIVDIKEAGRVCEIIYNKEIGKESGVNFRAFGIFPAGKDTITINLDNSEFDPNFEYTGGNKIRKGYIPFEITYHYIGNTTPLERVTDADGRVTFEKADVILAEGETTEEKIEFDGFIKGSVADIENQESSVKYFRTSNLAANAYEVYKQYSKTQFLTIFDAVDFKNLPPMVQGLIVSLGGMVGVSKSDIIRYYEVLSGAKNLYELSTKGFQHYNSLPPELKKKISKQLGVKEETLGTIIPLAGDLTDMATGKRFNKPGEKEAYLKGLFEAEGQKLLDKFGPNGEVWDTYNKVEMVKDTSSGKMVRKVTPGAGKLDPKVKQTIAATLGFTDIKELKPPFEKRAKLDADGKKIKDSSGNDVMEDVTHIEQKGLAIIKCGVIIEKAMQFRNNLAKGIELKNTLLQKYEQVKNNPNLLEDEAALLSVYDTIVDTREEVEKEGIVSDIYDSAVSLTADPYADFLDEQGKIPGAGGDPEWRNAFNVLDKYEVELDNPTTPPGGVTGTTEAGHYVIYTYDWVTDIIQDSNTGEIVLVGTPPPGFVYDPKKDNWFIQVR